MTIPHGCPPLQRVRCRPPRSPRHGCPSTEKPAMLSSLPRKQRSILSPGYSWTFLVRGCSFRSCPSRNSCRSWSPVTFPSHHAPWESSGLPMTTAPPRGRPFLLPSPVDESFLSPRGRRRAGTDPRGGRPGSVYRGRHHRRSSEEEAGCWPWAVAAVFPVLAEWGLPAEGQGRRSSAAAAEARMASRPAAPPAAPEYLPIAPGC